MQVCTKYQKGGRKMLKMKSKWAKRMLALALSGAMIVTNLTTSHLTADAAEDTGEGYSYEVEETQEAGEDTEAVSDGKEETAGEDSGADLQEENADEETEAAEKTVERTVKETVKEVVVDDTEKSVQNVDNRVAAVHEQNFTNGNGEFNNTLDSYFEGAAESDTKTFSCSAKTLRGVDSTDDQGAAVKGNADISVTVDGKEYKAMMKMASTGVIKFTAPKDSDLCIIAFIPNDKTGIKVDGTAIATTTESENLVKVKEIKYSTAANETAVSSEDDLNATGTVWKITTKLSETANNVHTIQRNSNEPGIYYIKVTEPDDGKEEGPGTSGSSEGSGTPGSSEGSGTPGSSEAAGTPGSSEAAGTPGSSEAAGTPGSSESADTSGSSEGSFTPGSDIPDSSEPAGDELSKRYGQEVKLPAREVGNKLSTTDSYGINAWAKIEVLQDMNYIEYKDSNGAVTPFTVVDRQGNLINGVEYTGFFQGTTGLASSHTVPAADTAAFKISDVTKKTEITFITKLNKSEKDNTGKPFYFVNADSGKDNTEQDISGSDTYINGGKALSFTMLPGNTYYFYSGGKSKAMVAAIYLKELPEGGDTPGSSEGSDTSGSSEGSDTPGSSEGADTPGSSEGSDTPGSSESGTDESEVEEPETEDEKIKADEKEDVIYLNDKSKITVTAANVFAAKTPQYKVSVTYKNSKGELQELKEGVHYKVCFVKGYDGTTPGDQKIVVEQVKDNNKTDLGTFKGTSASVKYTLLDKKDRTINKNNDISKLVKGVASKTETFTGTYITPGIVWKTEPVQKDGKDQYTVVYRNNVNAGKASVTILGQGDYYGSKTVTFTIKPAKLTDINPVLSASGVKFGTMTKGSISATTAEGNPFTYKGSPITFNGLKMEYNSKDYTTNLKKSIDYTIDYKKNAQEGSATATIKGINNYTGSIKITYAIKNADVKDLTKATVVAERALQGSGVTELRFENGVTLKAGVDFKPDNKPLKEVTEITAGQPVSVPIKGLGSYKKTFAKGASVSVTKIESGRFHIKAGVIVDSAKLSKAGGDLKKQLSAIKVLDVNGKKISDKDGVIERIGNVTDMGIEVIAKTGSGFDTTTINCHVATKLSSAAKQDKIAIVKEFDGVNTITLTKSEIVKHIGDKKGLNVGNVVKANQIEIVSYKNNHKPGNATVTIQAKDDTPFYGTLNIKFKINPDKKAKDLKVGTGAEDSDTPTSGEPGSEPTDEPSSEPTSQPSSEPASQPSSEPASEPGGETSESLKLNANDLTAGDITSDVKVGIFTLKADNEMKSDGSGYAHNFTVDSNSTTFDDGAEFTQRLKTNGKSNKDYRSIWFTTKSAGTLKVWARGSNSTDERVVTVYNATDDSTIGGKTIYPNNHANDKKVVSYTINGAGTYYIGTNGATNYYGVEFIPEGEGSDTPGSSETSETPGSSETSETPGSSETSDTPGSSETSETPGSSETSDTPSSSETSDTPGSSETSETPGSSETSDTPGSSETSDTPSSSETSDTPSSSETSETPGSSETSDTSGSSEAPETQDSSGGDQENQEVNEAVQSAAPRTSITQWFKNLFSSWFN